ncbi:MAG: bifunctional oligoribonuclease/PAP phosphatase NrnA [Bacteroidia bacterium]|nr:bifunctional oligoribonuclease/PAP phosphatase NrnA [Bacteroidia bacterium]
MNTFQVTELKELLSTPKRIAITMHAKADGDAIGSSLGWYHYLKGAGHRVEIVSPTDYPENLKWLVGTQDVMVGPTDADRASWIFEGADVIFCLDFNSLHRLNDFAKVVEDSMATKVMIDHHLDPEAFYQLAYWDDEASSTAELIYRLIEDLGEADKVNADIAQCLYTGILTDTGSFRFTNTSPRVHKIISHLMEAGADNFAIHEAIFSNYSEDRLKFLGHALLNCLHVKPELNAAYILLNKEVFKNYNLKSGDTEGLVNYALSIDGVKLGALISTQDDLVKFSLRSKHNVSASQLAQKFGGGGHFYAAGAKIVGKIEDAEQKFLELLESEKEMLTAE